jgi:hypothetical protein
LLSVILLGASSVAPAPAGAVTPSEVRSLRGASGVEVVVENLTDELQRLGLSAEQLGGEIQSRLRERGIRVLTAQDQAPGRPWLYVRVFALKSTNVPLVSYFVTFQVRQDATLDRAPDAHVAATTWDVGAVGLAGSAAIVSAVHDTTEQLADRFTRDFLAVNPKP